MNDNSLNELFLLNIIELLTYYHLHLHAIDKYVNFYEWMTISFLTSSLLLTMGSATGLKLGAKAIIELESEPNFNINLYKII